MITTPDPAFTSIPSFPLPSTTSSFLLPPSLCPLSSTSSWHPCRNFQSRQTLHTNPTLPFTMNLPSSPASLDPTSEAHVVSMSGIESIQHRIDTDIIRIALPSKGDMSKDTMKLLEEIGMDVVIKNPRQYVASLAGFPNVEVWLQRPSDIARKLKDGDIDLGFTGHDLISEYAIDDVDPIQLWNGENNTHNNHTRPNHEQHVIPVHEDLGFGACRLSIGVPMRWTDINSVQDLAHIFDSPQEDPKKPLRIATKFINQTHLFMARIGLSNYQIVNMDGALEASTQMGTADCIVDLVASGVTLRENLLKEIQGGIILESSMRLVANRKALANPKAIRLRDFTRQLLECIDAHLKGKENFNIIANIRGSNVGNVARKLSQSKGPLKGMDGPTISTVIAPAKEEDGMYAIGIVVPKKKIYEAVRQLRNIGGSGVCVLPVTYVFDGVSDRWDKILTQLGLPLSE